MAEGCSGQRKVIRATRLMTRVDKLPNPFCKELYEKMARFG